MIHLSETSIDSTTTNHVGKNLGFPKAIFSPAVADSINRGVLDENNNQVNTPHAFYVDDDVYSDLYDTPQVEQAVAASIEAIFTLLGNLALNLRQGTVSFDKMIDTTVSYNNHILGRMINIRTMMVSAPSE